MTAEKEKHSLRQLASHDSHRDSGSLTEVGSRTGMEARKKENQLLANPLMCGRSRAARPYDDADSRRRAGTSRRANSAETSTSLSSVRE